MCMWLHSNKIREIAPYSVQTIYNQVTIQLPYFFHVPLKLYVLLSYYPSKQQGKPIK